MEPLGVLRVEILGEIAMGLHWAGELLETGIVENPAPGSCCKKMKSYRSRKPYTQVYLLFYIKKNQKFFATFFLHYDIIEKKKILYIPAELSKMNPPAWPKLVVEEIGKF